ncbi:hypothetical protein MTBBW1_870006 [Desulfamplus magnetovallimortis]|uniref:Transposase n=1 Tax=Desulfamplus magnetovallimortis TaxID=1246637 RepID=A0A1W1HKY6_9BACT|nr:hypothetical protein [Desulfamplus magnetovallimortis]SLM33085.1 hypothetical protein MTBBW1_870006 [Desulfamplus magnetovallimortis]
MATLHFFKQNYVFSVFAIYIINEEGDVVKKIPLFIDGTTEKLDGFLVLFEHYLVKLEIEKASEVVLVGDGAPWIWECLPKLIRETGGEALKITEIIDWTHAEQNLERPLEHFLKRRLLNSNTMILKNCCFLVISVKLSLKSKDFLKCGHPARL